MDDKSMIKPCEPSMSTMKSPMPESKTKLKHKKMKKQNKAHVKNRQKGLVINVPCPTLYVKLFM